MSDSEGPPAAISYELFADDPCQATIPIGDLVDRFEYARFAPLLVESNGATERAVIPLDHVMPHTFGFLGRSVSHDVYANIANRRGGAPLFEEWKEIHPAAGGRPVEVEVEDLARFLARPRARIDGQETELALQPATVRTLLAGGEATLAGETATPIVIRPPAAFRRSLLPSTPVIIADLPAFIAQPEITLESGARLAVDLSARNVRELSEAGSTRVAVSAGPAGDDSSGESVSVTVSVAAPTGVETATSALTTIDGTPGLRSVDDRAGLIHTVEPPAIDLAATGFEFALYLPYRQEWRLLGYSRGALLNSIPLAPLEETTIEVFSWDRTTTSTDVTTMDEQEATLEGSVTRRDTVDVLGELTKTSDWRTTYGGQIGLPPIEGVTVGGQFSQQLGETVGRLNRATINTIDESVFKASARLRASRQTKVSETREWGRETRVTRRIRNANECRTVTYDFFELLANYRVATRPILEEMRLAVLVKNPLPQTIDRSFLLAHEGVLRDALLDPELERGFDAARILAASELYCRYRCAPECECEKRKPAGGQQPGAQPQPQPQPLPTGTDSVRMAEEQVQKSDAAVRQAIETLKNATHRVASVVDSGGTDDEIQAAITEYHQWLFREFGLKWFNPAFWSACLDYTRDPTFSPEQLERFLNRVAGSWLETLVRGTFLAGLAVAAAPIMAAQLVFHLGLKTGWYLQFTGFDDAGLAAALDQARNDVRAWRDAMNARITTGTGAQSPSTGMGQPTAPPPAITAIAETAMPRPFPPEQLAAHDVAETALLAHVRMNRGHYYAAIWRAMDPVDRGRLLGFYERLNVLVENEVLGFVGDKIAVPYSTRITPGLADAFAAAAEALALEPASPPREITLPTRGIHIQPRLGECDVCEPAAVRRQELDLEARRASVDFELERVRQAQLESERYRARLDQSPPLLDDPELP